MVLLDEDKHTTLPQSASSDCPSLSVTQQLDMLCCRCLVQVFGVGIPNPYRLRPFIGARVPVNSSFSPLINIHNPHSEPLQVTLTTVQPLPPQNTTHLLLKSHPILHGTVHEDT